jgi:hypothetical protein
MYLFLLWSRRVYPAVRHKYFISAVRSPFCRIIEVSELHCRIKGSEELMFCIILILCFFEINLV